MSAVVALLGGWRATVFAVLAALALSVAGLQTMRLQSAQLRWSRHQMADAKAALQDVQDLLRIQRKHAADMAAIAERYEQEKAHGAQAAYDRALADVRAGRVRLREPWRDVPATATAAERDAAAERRAEAAARVVRIGAEADAQLRACQAVIAADRK